MAKLKTFTKGFTLIELVMIILLLAILAAVGIPGLIEMRIETKNNSTLGALGNLRAAILMAEIRIRKSENMTSEAAKFPTLQELKDNSFSESRGTLKGERIFEGEGIRNPWSIALYGEKDAMGFLDCGKEKGVLSSAEGSSQRGWCYSETTGEVWANSNQNGSAAIQKSENFY